MLSNRPVWLLALAVIGAAALGAWSASLLTEADRGAEQDRDLLCEAINGGRSSLRNLLVSARTRTPKDKLTAEARLFYREQIRAVKPLDCGNFNRDSLKRQQEQIRTGGGAASGNSQPP